MQVFLFFLAGVFFSLNCVSQTVTAPFSTVGEYLGVRNGAEYTPFFIKGVNLGAAVPGAWPGQLPISSEQYALWFKMMADAGFNTLRIYTLHYPRFYQEFEKYNLNNPDKPLYLLQGVWLDEREEDPNWNGVYDLHEITHEFDKDIYDMIDVLHGNKNLPGGQRFGYAYGNYTADVSPWVLGFIIGREIHPYEVAATNNFRTENNSYTGSHLAISNASPFEIWAVRRLDNLIAYEINNYNTTRPVAFSSWITLDPLRHPSEYPRYEDSEQIDLNKVQIVNAPGGFFISYHAYPYYPDFISREEKYRNIYDDMGENPYLGYLRELKAYYEHPILIAEFGLPSSWGNARYSPSRMNHGGVSEEQQGIYTMRMFRNIYDTRYCGGIVFSWMDEWFKTTWITHALTSNKRRYWHNVISPENNYGLIHFVPNPNYYTRRETQTYSGTEKISQVSVWHDFTWFNVDAELTAPLENGDTLWIAYDTYRSNLGESTLPNGKKAINNRAEFLVRVTADSAVLYVTKSYNMQGIMFRNCFNPAFESTATDGEPWMVYRWQNSNTLSPPNIQDLGIFNIYHGVGQLQMHHSVQIRQNGVFVRIPWTLLHFSDPSSSMVIHDSGEGPARCLRNFFCGMEYLNSTRSDGIAVTVVHDNQIAEQPRYIWNDWGSSVGEDILDKAMFVEEEKLSLAIIREGLKKESFSAPTPTIKINTHPAEVTIVLEGNISEVLSVEATIGQYETISYQWYVAKTDSNADGEAIPNETGPNFVIPKELTATENYYYFCELRATNNIPSVRSNVATVRVVTSMPTYIASNELTDVTFSENLLRAYTSNGLLYISGLTAGEILSIYTVTGALAYRGVATGEEMYINLPAQGMYIVTSGNNTVKAVFFR